MWTFIAASILALLTSGAVCAQPGVSSRRLTAVRVRKPPVIDGKLDDECWRTLTSTTGFTDSILGTAMADQTVVWVGYDDRNIYAAFHCKDSDPRGIVARETRRGIALTGEDQISMSLNTFRSGRTEDENWVSINPLGTQSASFAGGHAAKQEWEGTWQSAARIVEDGWDAEMAVPWRILARPPGSGGKITIGINFWRYQARTQVGAYWSDLGPQIHYEQEGTWEGVELPRADTASPLSALAYVLAGYDRSGVAGRAGIDARYQISPQLTALGSVKPDFSNIEGAVTSIDFSYTEKLADERRPYFLEGSGYLNASNTGYTPFASQRIDQFDLGAKFYGRVAGSTDLGLLATTEIGRRTDAAVRVHHALSALDSVDAAMVSRVEDGLNNTLGLVSSSARRGNWTLSGAYSRSFDTIGGGDRAGTGLSWECKHWSASVGDNWTSRRFSARDGYVSYTDDRNTDLYMGYSPTWRSGPLTGCSLSVDSSHDTHYDGTFFRRSVDIGATATFRTQLMVGVWLVNRRFEDNRDRVWSVGAYYPKLDKFRNYGVTYTWGREAGFDYYDLSPYFNWRFFNRLVASVSSEVVRLDGTRTQDVLSLSYDLTRQESVAGRLIERNGHLSWYASFRHSGYAGADYYVILGDPNSDRFAERLMVKVVQPL